MKKVRKKHNQIKGQNMIFGKKKRFTSKTSSGQSRKVLVGFGSLKPIPGRSNTSTVTLSKNVLKQNYEFYVFDELMKVYFFHL